MRRSASRMCWGLVLCLVLTSPADAHRVLEALRCNSVQHNPEVLQHGVGGGGDAVYDDAACRQQSPLLADQH